MHRRQTDDDADVRDASTKGAVRPRHNVRGRRHGGRGHSGADHMKGAAWLLEPGDAASMLTPERLSDEHRLIGQTAREFAEKGVIPAIDRLETKDWAFARHLLERCGELGLLGVDAPEEYAGVGLDRAAALVVRRH